MLFIGGKYMLMGLFWWNATSVRSSKYAVTPDKAIRN